MQAHQAAIDEKVAEVANLTLRLREMSGKVMWFEAQQGETKAEIDALKLKLEAAEAKAHKLEVTGVSPIAADTACCNFHLIPISMTQTPKMCV